MMMMVGRTVAEIYLQRVEQVSRGRWITTSWFSPCCFNDLEREFFINMEKKKNESEVVAPATALRLRTMS